MWRGLSGLAGGAIAALAAPAAAVAGALDCDPAEGLRYICGTGPLEDIARVPGTRWLIGSGLNTGSPARLRVIDAAARRVRPAVVAFPAGARRTGDCPGPPDLARWSTDGIALARRGRGRGRGRFRLFVANHGDRQAIELFEGRVGRDGPRLRWTGCAPLPAGAEPNAIAAIDARTIFVTSFRVPGDPDGWAKMARREPTGGVWLWREGRGFSPGPGGPVSGANGIALSADRRTLYVAAWSDAALLSIDRRTGVRRRIAVDFLPDNIHVDNDGSLLVGGQQARVAAIAACGAQCPQPWVVARIDPATGRRTTLASGRGSLRVNYACGAMRVGADLYITVRGDDRIAWRPIADGGGAE